MTDVCDAIHNVIDFISDDYKEIYSLNIKEKNINGQVLSVCDLTELKGELKMAFGDWELFKSWIVSKRLSQLNVAQRKAATINVNLRQLQQNVAPSNKNRITFSSNTTNQSEPTNESSWTKKKATTSMIKLENIDTSQTQPRTEDSRCFEKHAMIEENRTNPETPSKSVTTNFHGRKVEFYITPVIEDLSDEKGMAIENNQQKFDHSFVKKPSLHKKEAEDTSNSTRITLISLDRSSENLTAKSSKMNSSDELKQTSVLTNIDSISLLNTEKNESAPLFSLSRQSTLRNLFLLTS